MNIDLTALTLSQVFATLAIIAAFDVLTAIAAAFAQGTFSLGAVAVWIQSHVLKRVFPIFALAVLGHGLAVNGTTYIPAIEPAWWVAIAGLTAYVLETIASIRGSFADASRPADTTPTA